MKIDNEDFEKRYSAESNSAPEAPTISGSRHTLSSEPIAMARDFPERKRHSDNDIMGTVTILCYYQNLHNLDRLFRSRRRKAIYMSTLENEETTEAYHGREFYLNIQNEVPPRNFLKIRFFFRRGIANTCLSSQTLCLLIISHDYVPYHVQLLNSARC